MKPEWWRRFRANVREALYREALEQALIGDAHMHHYKDGWFFEKRQGGGVNVFRTRSGKEPGATDLNDVQVTLEIDADSWQSILQAVGSEADAKRIETRVAKKGAETSSPTPPAQ